ncbi:MAG TPA: cysteine--tRNA ligase, partial [Clostridia bacterium]|nr:cysteine--tRNA ligase [Clostridia bacterium]
VHHENEIAQSQALTGQIPARIWMHAEFMMVDNGKMSKSLGNTYTVADLAAKGFKPLAFRYLCLNVHYRNKLNFTWDALKGAQISYDRLREAVNKNKDAGGKADNAVEAYMKEFEEAVSDDLNIPKALGILWSMLKNCENSRSVYDAALKMDSILGLSLDKEKPAVQEEIPAEIMALVNERNEARKQKDWAKSDKLRDMIISLGYEVKDTPEGAKVSKKV